MSTINPLALGIGETPAIDPLARPVPHASSGSSGSSGSSSSNPLAALATNSQEFLQLLVAQLKYQDPLNPTSGTEFLSQTAQMSAAAMTATMDASIKSLEATTDTMASATMIGKTVTGLDPSGTSVTGPVTGVTIDPTHGPMLQIGSDTVALSQVTQVTA